VVVLAQEPVDSSLVHFLKVRYESLASLKQLKERLEEKVSLPSQHWLFANRGDEEVKVYSGEGHLVHSHSVGG
jgi:hypothetical protein